jgi:endo-1,4-beta-D-glucanase Y
VTRTRRLAVLSVVLAAAGVAVAVAATRDPGPRPSAPARFLATYVDEDGRVLRHDQGGDSVSEGQAYAMLIAAGTGREARFDRIWSWTRAHLRRSDGLLAWRWAGGRVADPEPAADADLDAARALLVAARRFRRADLRREGLALARAIVAHETVSHAGAPVLVAGPWARRERVLNPSYLSPRAFAEIGRAGTSPVWRRLERSSVDLLEGLTRRPPHLAPDWARLDGDQATPAGAPDRGGAPVHGWDAVRVNLRLAESCDPAARRIAARAWPALRDGRASAVRSHPAALVDAAAAAHAAGDADAAGALLDRAQALDAKHPTYYGAALTALARVALETDGLGRC